MISSTVPYYSLLLIIINCHNSVSKSFYSSPFAPLKEKSFYVETFFKANWFRAGEFCRYHGMQLASINNKKENDEIMELLKSLNIESDMWVSGSSLNRKSYVWAGNGHPITYKNFFPGQPDQTVVDNEKESCIQLRKEFGFMWNDMPCTAESYFICERQLNSYPHTDN